MSSNEEFDISAFRDSYDAEVLKSIGLMVAASSAVEHTLHLQNQRLMSHPAEVSPIAVCVSSGAQFNVLLGQIRTLVQIHVPDGDDREPVLGILDQIRDRYTHRNEIVHGFMKGTRDGVSIVRVNIKKGRVLRNLERDKDFIDEIASEMMRLTRDLDHALNELGITQLPKRDA